MPWPVWTCWLLYLAGLVGLYMLLQEALRRWNKHLIQTKSFPELLFTLASTGGFFTAFLNIHNCIVGAIKLGKGKFEFAYMIPRHLSTAQGVLDLGGVLAVADEVTTVLLCCEDKTHRAGVSVTLTGEILRPECLKACETVWIETEISKVGAALGFVEMTMWKSSEKKDLLARVSHIKYLKTGGKMWDILSPLMPSLVLLIDRFGWSGSALKESEYLPLDKLLDVKFSSPEHSDSEFELISHHSIQNHFKFLHGGAISMSITDAVTKFHVKSQTKSGGKHVCPQSLRWMEMQYLAPCKGKVAISIIPQASTKNGDLPPNDSLEHIHSFRVLIHSLKGSKGKDQRKCLAHGSVLFY